jgi:hypothetical protein
MQSLCIKRFSVKIEASRQFGCDMLGIGCASAVSAKKNFAIVAVCAYEHIRESMYFSQQLFIIENVILYAYAITYNFFYVGSMH